MTINFRLVAVALALLPPLGCSKRSTPVTAGLRTQTLHVGNGVEPHALDPQLTIGASDWLIQTALFETLITPDPATGQPTLPGVATSWEMSPDMLTYTFHLRRDAMWSDGKRVVAEDFVLSAKRALSPKIGSEVSNDFFEVAGARAYFGGKERDFTTVGVRAVDAHTLEYRLEEPTPVFMHRAAGRLGMPVPLHVIERHVDHESRKSAWSRAGNLVGNGPFVLKQWIQHKMILLEKSSSYWDRDRVKLNSIVFHPVENPDTEEKMFRAGQLHLTSNVPTSKLEVWQRSAPALLRLDPEERNRIIVINCTRAPFTDPRVRRALALAIDRQQLVRVLGGNRPVARSFTPPNGTDFKALPQFEENVGAARELLAEAGFPNGSGFRRIEVLLPNRGHARLTAEMLQDMWRKNLGIEIIFNIQEWGVYIDSENNGHYDLCYDGWAFPHPHLHFDLNRTGCTFSRYLWSSSEYDALFREAARAPDSTARNEIYGRMEAILAREMPVIPLHFEVVTYLLHPAVKGWMSNWPNLHPWKFVSLDPTNGGIAETAGP